MAGIATHSVLLVTLLCHADLGARAKRSLLLALALVPIARIATLVLPLVTTQIDYQWYLLPAVAMLLAGLIVARQTGLSRLDLNLRVGSLPLQLVIGLLGIPIGIIEYTILQPASMITEPSWREIWLPAVALVVSSGLAEEFMFRGVLQATALATLGRRGLIYVALVFAIQRLGNGSWLDAVLMFCVGLLFAWLVSDSLSLLGVSLAHGLASVMLYLILPFVSFQISFGGSMEPQWAEAPPSEEIAGQALPTPDYPPPFEIALPPPISSPLAPADDPAPALGTVPPAQVDGPAGELPAESYPPLEDAVASPEEEAAVAGMPPEPVPPEPAAVAVRSFDTERYVVKPRDTLFGIAVKHGATLDLLKELNGRGDNTAVLPGQVIVVPVGFPRKWEDYEVQPGDTLSGIAATRASTQEALLYVNGLPAGAELQAGQQLLIPPPRR